MRQPTFGLDCASAGIASEVAATAVAAPKN
jgi:hypothetical protein